MPTKSIFKDSEGWAKNVAQPLAKYRFFQIAVIAVCVPAPVLLFIFSNRLGTEPTRAGLHAIALFLGIVVFPLCFLKAMRALVLKVESLEDKLRLVQKPVNK